MTETTTTTTTTTSYEAEYPMLKRGSAEWVRAWDGLRSDDLERYPQLRVAHTESLKCAWCNHGECWEYMGTTKRNPLHEGVWVHEFRHRDHPIARMMAHRAIPAVEVPSL